MEATMVCIDNSEWTRSGDYAPTRFKAQTDAINLLAGAKTEANAESTVGVLTMSGKTPRVLVTPTPDLGKILTCMTEISIEGECNISAAVQIAQLALKHRQNKNQRQRIIIFAGSPISEDKERLVKMAKKLKKNNVAVDIVSFGCEVENQEKLEAFHGAVNSNDNSHLVIVPIGPVLIDVLLSSPIFQIEGGNYGFGGGPGAGAAGGGGGGGGGDGYEFGVDPNMDPELALALRVSLEEERARQNAAAGTTGAAADGAGASSAGPATATPSAAAAGMSDMDMDEDALLQQALAMSMAIDEPEVAATPAAAAAAATPAAAAQTSQEQAQTLMEGVDEDDELALALSLSMQDAEPEAK
ncbi:MAG: hypothetical protein WDW38_010105 [Sanguina aurantia]